MHQQRRESEAHSRQLSSSSGSCKPTTAEADYGKLCYINDPTYCYGGYVSYDGDREELLDASVVLPGVTRQVCTRKLRFEFKLWAE